MQIIAPTYITDATLISTDIPDVTTGTTEWDTATIYNYGTRVSVNYESDGITPGVHRIYECTWTPNTNLYPPDNLAAIGGFVYWTLVSATERWKLFDMIVAPDRANASGNIIGSKWGTDTIWEVGTAWDSSTYSSMQVTVEPGVIDTVSILNIDAESVGVIVIDPIAGEVYAENQIPSTKSYCNVIFEDIPSYPNATVTAIIRNRTEDVNVGEIVYGKIKTLGKALYGVNVGLTDYSVKQVSAFGEFSILERAFSKRIDCNFIMPMATHSGVMRILENYRSTPLVWIISSDYSTTLIYGYYRDFSMNLPDKINAQCSLSIEGLGGDMVNATPIPDPWVEPWDGFNHLTVPAVPTLSLATSKIEEAPVAPDDPIALNVPSVPTLADPALVVYPWIGNCTISQAEPGVVTCAGHGLLDTAPIFFQTTGALPSPIVAGDYATNIYYVRNKTDDTFNISVTVDGYLVDTTNAGSGTHKLMNGTPI